MRAIQSLLLTGVMCWSFEAPAQLSVTVTRPVEDEVTNGTLRLIVDCSDGNPQGCPAVQATIVARCRGRCSSTPSVPPKIVSGQGSHLEWSVDVVPFLADQSAGFVPSVTVQATASTGQTVTASRYFWIDRSRRLIPVASPGRIFDFDDHRVLFGGASGPSILDLDTGAIRPIATGTLTGGALLRSGAVISRFESGANTLSVLSDAGVMMFDPFSTVQTSGDLVAVSSRGLYDAASGTWVVELGQPFAWAALTPRGDFAYATETGTTGLFDITLLPASRPATLIAQQQDIEGPWGIRTDGEAVAWHSRSGGYVLGQLDGGLTRIPGQAGEFQLESGWLIYPAGDDAGVCGTGPCPQIFTRAPDGAVTQRTFLQGGAYLDAVGPGGELAVHTSSFSAVAPGDGGAPVPFAETLGRPRYLDGGWWMSEWSTLFRVDLQEPVFIPIGDQPPPAPPCGCSAGGSAAAGILAAALLRRRRRPAAGQIRDDVRERVRKLMAAEGWRRLRP